MDIPIGDSGPGQAEGKFITIAHDLVDLPLFRREFAGGWVRPGEVRGVVHVVLRSCVDDHQFARFDDLVMEVVVESLTVLGQDGRERHSPAFLEHKALHLSDNILLDDSDLDVVPSDRVHFLSQSSGIVKLLNLTRFLDEPH